MLDMYGFKEIDVTGLTALRSGGCLALIDVRNEAETAQGLIGGAVHIPLHLLPLRAQELDSRASIVFYCRTGARSAMACAFMRSRGYDNVYNLRGGVMAWLQSGLALG